VYAAVVALFSSVSATAYLAVEVGVNRAGDDLLSVVLSEAPAAIAFLAGGLVASAIGRRAWLHISPYVPWLSSDASLVAPTMSNGFTEFEIRTARGFRVRVVAANEREAVLIAYDDGSLVDGDQGNVLDTAGLPVGAA
jgi:hypothetical protein